MNLKGSLANPNSRGTVSRGLGIKTKNPHATGSKTGSLGVSTENPHCRGSVPCPGAPRERSNKTPKNGPEAKAAVNRIVPGAIRI